MPTTNTTNAALNDAENAAETSNRPDLRARAERYVGDKDVLGESDVKKDELDDATLANCVLPWFDDPVTFHVFSNSRDTNLANKVSASCRDVVTELFGTHRPQAHKDGLCIIGSDFLSASGGRKDANVKAVSIVQLDFDNSKIEGRATEPADIKVWLQRRGFAGAIYTTYSHSAELTKFRVALFPKTPFKIRDSANDPEGPARQALFTRALKSLADDTGEPYDASCVNLARLFYLPAYDQNSEDAADIAFVEFVRGNQIDFDAIVEKLPPLEEKPRSDSPNNKKATGKAKSVGEFLTPGMKRFLAKYAAHFEIEEFLKAHDWKAKGKETTGTTFQCPNFEEHTKEPGDDWRFGFWAQNASDRTNGYGCDCSHSHCLDADRAVHLDRLCVALGIAHARDLLPWCPGFEHDDWVENAELEAAEQELSDASIALCAVREKESAVQTDLAKAEKELAAATKTLEKSTLALAGTIKPTASDVQKSAAQQRKHDEQTAKWEAKNAVHQIAANKYSDLKSEAEKLSEHLATISADAIAAQTACEAARAKLDDLRAAASRQTSNQNADFAARFETRRARYNDRHAVVKVGASTAVLWPATDMNPLPTFMSVDAFHNFYANDRVWIASEDGDGGRFVAVSKEWMTWRERHTLSGVVCQPYGFGQKDPTPANVLNLFDGWAVKPDDTGHASWALFKAHMLDNICNGDLKHFDWLMSWLSQMVKEPHKKPGTVIVLQGGKGTGKSVFAKTIKRLFKRANALTISKKNQIVGNFNKHLAAAVFVIVEEALFAGDPTIDGVLKELISGDTQMIEAKGVDAIEVANHMHLMFCTNEAKAVPATEGERRYFVLIVNSAKKDNADYFAAIADQMDDKGLEAMMFDLLMWAQPTHVNLRNPPRTDGLKKQIALGLKPVERWLADCLQTGAFKIGDEHTVYWPQGSGSFDIAKRSVADAYKLAVRGDKYAPHSDTLGAVLEGVGVVDGGRPRVGDKAGPRVWSMPSLDEIRLAFSEKYGVKFDDGTD